MIIQQIDEKLKEAMRAKNELSLTALRMIKSALNYKKIELQKELGDEEVVAVLRSEIKKRQESAEVYQSAGWPELADKEKKEIAVLSEFLPIEISEEEIMEIAKAELVFLTEDDKRNFGKVMAAVMAKVKGKASGSAVSQAVKKLLV